MSNGDKKKLFADQLIKVLDHYIQNPGLFAALLGGAAHHQLAYKMKVEAKYFFNNPTDENWGIFVKAFNIFHETLVEKESQSLLTAINEFIRKSEFPDIITTILYFNQLNANAAVLNAELTVHKPPAEYVMADLRRQLPLSISLGNNVPKPLSDFVDIRTDTETNNTVIASRASNLIIYEGVTNSAEEAEKALEAIKKELLPMPLDILPFLCQNGVLEQGLVDITNTIVDDHPERVLVPPSHQIHLHIDENGMTITESYIFEKYKMENEHGEMDEHSFATPVKVVDSFDCRVSKDGNTATISNRKVEFSPLHETLKESAGVKQKNM